MTLLRLTRATRYLPKMRGVGRIVGPVQSLYRPFIDRQRVYRIANFDGDLLLDVKPTDTIGAALWHIPQLWERHERKLFCSAIKPGCTVLDVGANIGVYTLLAAKRGARVFAIEVDQENVVMLQHHVELNRPPGAAIVSPKELRAHCGCRATGAKRGASAGLQSLVLESSNDAQYSLRRARHAPRRRR